MHLEKCCFALLALASIGAVWRSLALLFTTAFYNPQYSHIVLILPLVLALLYSERAKVFRRVEYYFPAGLFLLLLAVAFAWLVRNPLPLSSNDTLFPMDVVFHNLAGHGLRSLFRH